MSKTPVARRQTPAESQVLAATESVGAREKAVAGFSVVAALAASITCGILLARHTGGIVHDRMLPWILARGFGLAAYLALVALVAIGIWFRHPWRVHHSPRPETLLRVHAALAASTILLLLAHIAATALDRYAGVGWAGAFVPWHSSYRPTAITLGTLAFYGIGIVTLTAALSGSIARRVWLPVHSVSATVLALCLVHGLLAGSDSRTLWWLYAGSGAFVVVLQVSRILARRTLELDPC